MYIFDKLLILKYCDEGRVFNFYKCLKNELTIFQRQVIMVYNYINKRHSSLKQYKFVYSGALWPQNRFAVVGGI